MGNGKEIKKKSSLGAVKNKQILPAENCEKTERKL